MLLYGDYPALHRKVLSALFAHAPADMEMRFWLNAVCPETLAWLINRMPPNTTLYVNDENRPKYKAMQLLFHHARYPITTPWVTWLDDDAIVMKPDWYKKTSGFINSHAKENVCFFGQQRRKGHQTGVRKFIREAAWFKVRKFQRIKGEAGSKFRGPGIVFIQGSYWWLRTDVMKQLAWPDIRLSHNGGDTLLSEAIWQQKLPQHEFFYGVVPNGAPRRGLSENPAGFTHKHRTKTDKKPATMVGRMQEYKLMLARLNHGFIQHDAHTILVRADMEPATRTTINASNVHDARKRMSSHRSTLEARRLRRK
jgi:hypothetical protein